MTYNSDYPADKTFRELLIAEREEAIRKDEREKCEKEIKVLKDTIQDRIKFEEEQEKAFI